MLLRGNAYQPNYSTVCIPTEDGGNVRKQCEAHGFLMLASALQEMSRVKIPSSILRTVYIANEI